MRPEQEGCQRAVFCMVRGADVIACAGSAIGLVQCHAHPLQDLTDG